MPITQDAWKEIKGIFHTRWNVPNAFGALDGKLMAMKIQYFNYNLQGLSLCITAGPCRCQLLLPVVDVGSSGS